MKKRNLVWFVFLVFGVSFVFGASCDDDQTIMRLYSPTNSHVSAWDQNVASYTEEICYDDIFGVGYSGADPHGCDGSNQVLSVYSNSNSHASDIGGYGIDLCYGDLECHSDNTPGESCADSDYEVVVDMYSNTNAHVSYPGDPSYNVKICCKSDEASAPLLYWANMDGEEITSADFGDTVYMIARGVSSGTFDIMEDDSVIPFTEVLFDDIITSAPGRLDGFNFVGDWTIKQEDVEVTNGDFDHFYFKIGGEKSGYLVINPSGDDDEMNVDILSPECGTYFNQSEVVKISINASDPDDKIYGTLRVNGRNESFSNGITVVDEPFDAPGNFQIVVESFNSRGHNSRDISNIMVLGMTGASYDDGEYVAACIIKPEDYGNIEGEIVEFDASATRGVNVSGGIVDVLNPNPPHDDAFSWYWRFFGDGIEQEPRSIENSNSETIGGREVSAYKFNAKFPTPGRNSASLRVEI